MTARHGVNQMSKAQLAGIGLAGTVFGFHDYIEELPYFQQEVMPRLERKGMRLPRA